MPGLALSLVLGVACATLGCHAAAPPVATTPSMPDNLVAAVRGTIEQWRQAYEVRSVDALEQLYAQDPEVSVIQQGVAIRGWTAVKASLEDRLSRATAVRVRLKNVSVVGLGNDGAAVVAIMAREVSNGATTVTEEGTLTFALRQVGASWSIVAEHYSYAVR